LLPDGSIEPVEIGKVGDVALHGRDVVADLGPGLVEFALATPHDENEGAFLDKLFGGRQAYSARSAGDDGDFSVQFGHDTVLSCSRAHVAVRRRGRS
jgi:hypothetical protein